MKTTTMALILFVAATAIWLAGTIEPAAPICGQHSAALYARCWRCYALAAELAILVAAAFQQLLPETLHLGRQL